MIDVLKSLMDAGITVLMGAHPYPTGTDTGPERSVVETWRIKQLAEELKKLNELIEGAAIVDVQAETTRLRKAMVSASDIINEALAIHRDSPRHQSEDDA